MPEYRVVARLKLKGPGTMIGGGTLKRMSLSLTMDLPDRKTAIQRALKAARGMATGRWSIATWQGRRRFLTQFYDLKPPR